MATTTTEELRLIELVCARLCHELIGPIGAVDYGLERLAESGTALSGADGDSAVEDMRLAEQSAKRATDLLKFYRIAYGTAAAVRRNGFEEVANLARIYAEPRRIALDFDPRLHLGSSWGSVIDGEDVAVVRGMAKLAVNAVLLAEMFLPRGGRVTIRTEASGRMIVQADGPGARIGESLRCAIERKDAALDPISVQARLTAMLAEAMGLAVALRDDGDDRVGMVFAPPAT